MTVFILFTRGNTMKKYIILFGTAITCIPHTILALSLDVNTDNIQCALGETGMTRSECLAQCSSGNYCCPKCYTATTKMSCPSGWELTKNTMNGNDTCARSDDTIVATDEMGYKKQLYGSCTPTETTTKTQFFRISTTQITDSLGRQQCSTCY